MTTNAQVKHLKQQTSTVNTQLRNYIQENWNELLVKSKITTNPKFLGFKIYHITDLLKTYKEIFKGFSFPQKGMTVVYFENDQNIPLFTHSICNQQDPFFIRSVGLKYALDRAITKGFINFAHLLPMSVIQSTLKGIKDQDKEGKTYFINETYLMTKVIGHYLKTGEVLFTSAITKQLTKNARTTLTKAIQDVKQVAIDLAAKENSTVEFQFIHLRAIMNKVGIPYLKLVPTSRLKQIHRDYNVLEKGGVTFALAVITKQTGEKRVVVGQANCSQHDAYDKQTGILHALRCLYRNPENTNKTILPFEYVFEEGDQVTTTLTRSEISRIVMNDISTMFPVLTEI